MNADLLGIELNYIQPNTVFVFQYAHGFVGIRSRYKGSLMDYTKSKALFIKGCDLIGMRGNNRGIDRR